MASEPLIFCTPENRIGKHDGDEFLREAIRFRDIHGGDLVLLEGTKKQKLDGWTTACQNRAGSNAKVVAFFGHGMPNSLPGLWSVNTLQRCADSLALCLAQDGDVVLYSCQAGLPLGFADQLCKACQRAWGFTGRIWGHTTAGHTTKNPNCTVYPAVTEGAWVVAPRSKLWSAWVSAMKTDYRYHFWTNRDPLHIAIDLQGSALAGARLQQEMR